MLFNSYEFIFLFLPIALFSYWLLLQRGPACYVAGWVIVLSLFFYGWWSARDLALILVSILANFFLCQQVARADKPQIYRKAVMSMGVSLNLMALGYFKYATMIKTIFVEGFAIGMNHKLDLGALPLAISFFTFQQIAYLVDAYRKHDVGSSLTNYAASVTFFPHLIAGPLVNYRDLYGQFETVGRLRLRSSFLVVGGTLFLIGLGKKLILADHLAVYADHVFGNPRAEVIGTGDAWIGALSYTFQLYFDFSGYSDMAIGLAAMFGIALPANFMSPYQSTSIIEFWRRWHITLSDFLKNYLYISLGGNRKGSTRRHLNLMITMLLGGLWHGAGYTFIIWGFLHGFYLTVNHLFREFVKIRIPRPVGIAVTFLCVVVAWVFFRADHIDHALVILKSMFSPAGSGAWVHMNLLQEKLGLIGGWLFVAALISFFLPNSLQLLEQAEPILNSEETFRKFPSIGPHWWRWRFTPTYALVLAVLFVVSVVLLSKTGSFIYYQF